MPVWTSEPDEEKEYMFMFFICGNSQFIAKTGTTLREAVCDACGASKTNSDVGSAILRVLGFYEYPTVIKITKYLKPLHIYAAQASRAISDVFKSSGDFNSLLRSFLYVIIAFVTQKGVKVDRYA